MPKPKVDAGGGWTALAYAWKKGREAGGLWKLASRLRARNACKTCALGMGGQNGGMVNEAGHFPEVCKKSMQAQAADMHAPIPESFFARHTVRDLADWTPRQLEYAGRLTFPVRCDEGDARFRRVSWDEAMDATASALRAAPPDETFVYASGRSSNEAAFLLQTFARAYGTDNVNNCSYYCHQASGVALQNMLGTGTATVTLDDLDRADFALVAGANPASNHPRMIVKLVELRRRGGTVVVVNPLKELGLVRFRIPSDPRSLLFGDDVSDIYLQPHIGSDVAVFTAVLKALVERDAVDRAFTSDHVEGWDAVERSARAASWDDLLASTGLGREEIDRVARAMAGAQRGLLLWAMGLTHHENGVDNVAALGNLALARGWVGKPGAGLLPIRGHSNVQGVGSMGFTPALKEAIRARMEEVYGVRASGRAGLDTYACMVAAHENRMRAAVLLGGNLYGSNPDAAFAEEALSRIGAVVHLSTKLNTGHVRGRGRTTIILPVLARDEEPQPTTQESMFNFVRLSDGGAAAPAGEARSEVRVVCDLAARVLPPGPFPFAEMTDHAAVRGAIANTVPGWEAIGEIDRSRREFQISGRTFHEPRFPTPSGKARARAVALPDLAREDGTFRLMTVRSEGQFNTVVYEEEDLYRGNDRRDVVMMCAGDAEARGLGEGDAVTVESETGSMPARVAFADLPPGNLAMYYPEANVLVPRRIDPASKTPAFKSVVVRVSRI